MMRRLLGLLGFLLGVIGSIACIAAIVLCWWASYRYLGQAVQAAETVEEMAVSADTEVDEVLLEIRTNKPRLEELQQATQRVAKLGKQSKQVDQERVRRFVQKLSPEIKQVEETIGTLRSAALLLKNGARFAVVFSEDEQQTERLRKVQETLGEAITTLQKVQGKLARARLEDDLQSTAKDLGEFATAAIKGVNLVEQTLSDASEFITSVKEEVASLRERILFWKTRGPALATLVLLWIALGQISLFTRGWSMMWGLPRAEVEQQGDGRQVS